MKRISLLTIMSLTLGIAQADTWTYAECVDYAREHNISLQKSMLSERNAEYDLEEAKAQWQPSLDFATTHGYANYPWADDRNNTYSSSYGLNAGWTVWNGGQRENSIRQSRLKLQIDRLNTADLMRTLETDLLQVYINLLYARESIAIYEEALKVSEAQAERALQLSESGKISRVDYAQLASQCEQDRYSLVNARSTYDTRRMELKKLLELGLDADIEPAPVEWDAAQVLADLPPMDESYQMALDTDLRLRGIEIEKESARLDVAIAKAGRMPQISLNAGLGTGYNTPGNAFGTSMKKSWNQSLGLTVSIPLFDNKKTKTAVARAKVSELDNRLDMDNRLTEIAQTVENWYIDTRSSQSRFKAAQASVESSELSARLTDERFKLGYVNTVELMTAHNDLIQARHTLLQAKYMAMLGKKMIDFYRDASVTLP
jgi:outer membrane efflux protein